MAAYRPQWLPHQQQPRRPLTILKGNRKRSRLSATIINRILLTTAVAFGRAH
jgi:hypothetical protein